MKLITRNTDYALRAICYIAKSKNNVVTATELVKKLQIPRPFLRKLLQILGKKRILKSSKGQGGGFILAVSPKDIHLIDLMRAFQGKFSLNECSFKKLICPNIKTCPLRHKLLKIEDYIGKQLNHITIAALIK